jgi:hypothetical protein
VAFNEKEVEKVLGSVESVSGRKLKYIEKKKVITDMPNNGKGNFVVMKKIGEKRFKISVFEEGKENKKLAFTAPTVKGMASFGIKAKVLAKVEQAEEVVVVPEVAAVEAAPAADVRQTPEDRVEDGEEVEVGSTGIMDRPEMKEYIKGFANDLSRASC